MHDYAAGKSDWIAADLPIEGTARLAGLFTRRGGATVVERTRASEAVRMLDAQGFGPVLVLNQAGVPSTVTPWRPPPARPRQGR